MRLFKPGNKAKNRFFRFRLCDFYLFSASVDAMCPPRLLLLFSVLLLLTGLDLVSASVFTFQETLTIPTDPSQPVETSVHVWPLALIHFMRKREVRGLHLSLIEWRAYTV